MNRIDKVVVFKPLGQAELWKILSLELNILQQRIFNSSTTRIYETHRCNRVLRC